MIDEQAAPAADVKGRGAAHAVTTQHVTIGRPFSLDDIMPLQSVSQALVKTANDRLFKFNMLTA
jgi:hypothetical protein